MFIIAVLFCTMLGNGFYEFSLPKIEGGVIQLSSLANRKVMLVTLPVDSNASSDSFLYVLDTLAGHHESDLTVIGVPSYEDGFTPLKLSELKYWYRSRLNERIIITDGLYTRYGSVQNPHPLFNWLGSADMNGMFNIRPDSPGYKYFINTEGDLYGVLKPQSRLHGKSVQSLINM